MLTPSRFHKNGSYNCFAQHSSLTINDFNIHVQIQKISEIYLLALATNYCTKHKPVIKKNPDNVRVKPYNIHHVNNECLHLTSICKTIPPDTKIANRASFPEFKQVIR